MQNQTIYNNYNHMETIINTIQGTFIVPKEKESALINWLQANAIRQGSQRVEEGNNYNGTQLIHD